MLWDVFCRVVDNFGDIGVCWRLAVDLASRGERVRLWTSDASTLVWMAPRGHTGVQVLPWEQGSLGCEPGEVVVEAFGCDPPPAFVHRMAAAEPAPVWINLEYLSAQDYVERSHGLPSPQASGPGAGLVKWFFYPGFTSRTGGLLREAGLMDRLSHAAGDEWLAEHGVSRRPGERLVSLFCYANGALPALLEALSDAPTLLLATSGAASTQVAAALGPSLSRGALRAAALPLMPQTEYDRLLAACDLNFVRGEDSFVRAQWAAKPFVWHIYPQDDGAHIAKLDAFLDLFLVDADPMLGLRIRDVWAAWNGLSPSPFALPPYDAWLAQTRHWRHALLGQADLVTQLIGFATEKR